MQVGIWMMWWRVLPISPVVSSSCDSQNHQVLGIAVYGSVWVDSYAPKASAASWLGAMQVTWQTLQVGRCLWGQVADKLLVRSWGDPETLPRQAPSLDLSLDTQLQAGITSTSLPNFFTGFSWKGCISVKSGGYWKHWVPVFYINLVWHLGRPQKAVSLLN